MPVTLTVKPISPTAIEVNWQPDATEPTPTWIIINEFTKTGQQIASSGQLAPTGGGSVLFASGLSPNTTYCYQVCTYVFNDAGAAYGCGPESGWCGTTEKSVKSGPPSPQPTKPYIVNVSQEPATLKGDGTITITWVSTSYNKFIVRWSTGGALITQVDIPASGSGTSGSWTTNGKIVPGLAYGFEVEGGTYAGPGFPDNYSGWGNSAPVTAMENDRSLVKFIEHSGINPAGLLVSAIMGGQTSLKQVMKLG